MKRFNVLFISDRYPNDTERDVHGVYKRMQMHVSALDKIAKVKVLFYVPPKVFENVVVSTTIKKKINEYFGCSLDLEFCKLRKINRKKSFWDKYVLPALYSKYLITQSVDFVATSGYEQKNAIKNQIDSDTRLIFAHRLNAMLPLTEMQSIRLPIFYDLDDIEHAAFMRFIKQPPKWKSKKLYYAQIPSILWAERKAVKKAYRTFVCSDKDKKYLQKIFKLNGITTIPNSVTIPVVFNAQKPTRDVLFLGNFYYMPNLQGAEFLTKKVWPKVIREKNHTRLLVAGKADERIKNFISSRNKIEYIGFVNNLGKLYSEVAVVCVPILSGAGTRIKTIEAAAYGKPIVSTKIGAEGLDYRNGKEVLIANDANEFADQIIRLLKDEKLAKKIGENAREKTIENYNIENIKMKIQKEVTAILKN
jgi:glycosyltransferase involved in cell wall biosynthesis